MKVLITADEIRTRALNGERLVDLNKDTIITPSARDIARELGVELKFTSQEALAAANFCNIGGDRQELVSLISRNIGDTVFGPDLVERIVKEVLAVLGVQGGGGNPVVEKDRSGLRLVRGDTVTCEPFSTGNPRDRVFLKDLLPLTDSPNMCAGFMTMEKSAFEWDLKYDEYDYIIEGELEIIVDGQTYLGKPGDVFFIPRGTRIVFSSPGKVKFMYVTYPANWSGQA